MTDGWTIAAVVAACGTWPFVAWQALETRRATDTATGALTASAATAIDAARARLDVEAPQIEVRVTGPDKHPQGPARGGGAGGEWPSDQVWHFPRDEGLGKDLLVDLAVVITTRSDRPVHLSFEGDLYEGGDSSEKATSFEVRPTPDAPGGTYDRQVTLRLRLTPGEWAQNYRAHAEGRPLPHLARGVVTAADYRDHGVVDTWECSFGAWPIEPVPELAGQWRLVWVNPNEAHPRWTEHEGNPLATRSYWQSRSQGVRLPDPAYELPERRRLALPRSRKSRPE